MFTSDLFPFSFPAVFFVTDFSRCSEPPTARLEKLASSGADAVILRAKELDGKAYLSLAREAVRIFSGSASRLILHARPEAASALSHQFLHLPLEKLKTLGEKMRGEFSLLGASCHSRDDALEAQRLGCSYVSAGHVFDTDCKRGLPGRGTAFLREVCSAVSVPVLAIGGVLPGNRDAVLKCGAAGFCVMSAAMICSDPSALVKEFKNV